MPNHKLKTCGRENLHLKDHLGNIRMAWADDNGDGFFESNEIAQANDYYPFGLKHSVDNYPEDANQKYLYNGKELQDESEWLDYGARMYDPALARFTCLDPIADKFAHVSPYNYAENRPIDGIDLWGLQYVSYTVTLHDDGTASHVMKDYRDTEKGYGPAGPGIEYNYVKNGESTGSKFIENMYGIYYGPDNPMKSYLDPSADPKAPDYSLDPIDQVDNIAKEHDQNYDAVGAVGKDDAMKNPATVPADKKFVESAQEYVRNSENGVKDPITGKPMTKEAEKAARQGIAAFSFLSNKKEQKEIRQKNDANRQKQQEKYWGNDADVY